MSKQLASLRRRALIKQNYRCCYCRYPVWDRDLQAFVAIYRHSIPEARLRQGTAEHLIPQCEGGTNAEQNIAVACRFCNATRHRARSPLNPTQFLNYVQQRVACGRWLPFRRQSDRTS